MYRPAAIAQLQTLGSQVGVEVFTLGADADPVDIARGAPLSATLAAAAVLWQGRLFGSVSSPLLLVPGAVALAQDLQKTTGKPYTVIVDTAGRQVIDGPLMEELAAVKAAAAPDETLLVVDSMTGQEAATVTERFNREVPQHSKTTQAL